MTMADHHHIANGPSSQIPVGKMSPQMRNSHSNAKHNNNEENCTVDASPLHNDPKKRKRKRLLAVLDKLHNNNNNHNTNNNDTTNTNLASVAAAAMAAAINAAAAAAASNENNNSILVNNNHILSAMSSASPSASSTTSSHSSSHELLMSKMSTSPSPSSMFSTNIARSMHDNAEILRNLFALSRSLPSATSPLTHHPAFPSPFALASSPSPNYVAECNNNNNSSNGRSENNFTPSPDQIKMMLLNNGKVVKTEVKEELMDEEEANCSASVRDSKTPLHEFLQLPKTTATSSTSSSSHMLYGSGSDGVNHHPAQLSPYHANNNSATKHFFFDQEMPLDLSMSTMKRRQSSSSSSAGSPSLTKQLLMQQTEQKFNAVFNPLGIQVPRDCSLSLQTTPNSDSISPNLPQYYQDLKVSPIVEDVAPGKNSIGYVCPICGQMFSLNDRLAKHIASRHKTKSPASESTKSYVCEVCDRSFAR